MFADLKESLILSIEALLREMQTENYRKGAQVAGVTPERLTAEFIVGLFTKDITPRKP
jgi:hypothetical protein